ESLHNADANKLVSGLADILDGQDIEHSLVFIDPEGLNWRWQSMETLAETVDCDVIVNFPSAGLVRNSTKTDRGTRETVAAFLGVPVDDIPTPFTEDWALSQYRKGLGSLGKDVSTEINVQSEGSFHYHLIPAVRR